jgi:hypothetical protein
VAALEVVAHVQHGTTRWTAHVAAHLLLVISNDDRRSCHLVLSEQFKRPKEAEAVMARISTSACDFWRRHHRILFGLGVVAATVAAVNTVVGFKHLLFGGPQFDFSGGDMKYRQLEVTHWFAGEPVYGAIRTAVYPPASYVMLWPFTGWLSTTAMLWLWAGIYLALLAWLVRQVLSGCEANGRLEKLFFALLPLSIYATGRSIEIGQIILVVMPLLIAGGMLLLRERSLSTDMLGSLLLLIALVKPTAAVPAALIAYVATIRWRPAVLLTGSYVVLTLIASAFQPGNVFTLVRSWLGQDERVNLQATTANIQKLLNVYGRGEWYVLTALILLGLTAFWVWRNRHADPWLLLGVTCLVARLWAYHRPFDDMLLLPAVVGLIRSARAAQTSDAVKVLAGALAVFTWLTLLTSRMQLRAWPLAQLAHARAQSVLWPLVLVFLVWYTWRSGQSSHPNARARQATRKTEVFTG